MEYSGIGFSRPNSLMNAMIFVAKDTIGLVPKKFLVSSIFATCQWVVIEVMSRINSVMVENGGILKVIENAVNEFR